MAWLPVTATSKAPLQGASLKSLLGAAVLCFPSHCKGCSWSRLSDKGLCPDCNRSEKSRLGKEGTINLRGLVSDLEDESQKFRSLHMRLYSPFHVLPTCSEKGAQGCGRTSFQSLFQIRLSSSRWKGSCTGTKEYQLRRALQKSEILC
jgi:hypothetical protein